MWKRREEGGRGECGWKGTWWHRRFIEQAAVRGAVPCAVQERRWVQGMKWPGRKASSGKIGGRESSERERSRPGQSDAGECCNRHMRRNREKGCALREAVQKGEGEGTIVKGDSCLWEHAQPRSRPGGRCFHKDACSFRIWDWQGEGGKRRVPKRLNNEDDWKGLRVGQGGRPMMPPRLRGLKGKQTGVHVCAR